MVKKLDFHSTKGFINPSDSSFKLVKGHSDIHTVPFPITQVPFPAADNSFMYPINNGGIPTFGNNLDDFERLDDLEPTNYELVKK